MSALPTEPGFYWWRKTASDPWRMVQIIQYGDGSMNAYDVEQQAWHGRALEVWHRAYPTGEWLAVPHPDSTPPLASPR
jgi:hypothetical protein